MSHKETSGKIVSSFCFSGLSLSSEVRSQDCCWTIDDRIRCIVSDRPLNPFAVISTLIEHSVPPSYIYLMDYMYLPCLFKCFLINIFS